MGTRLLEVSRHSPRVMRTTRDIATRPEIRGRISRVLNTNPEIVYEELSDFLNQLELEKNGLSILLSETKGDVELSITILAHLLNTSPSDLLARHRNELEIGRRVDSKEDTILKMLKAPREGEVPVILLDLSNLLKIDHEEIQRKLIDLANRLEKEEDIVKTINIEEKNPIVQIAIAAKLCNQSIPDMKVRHPLLFRDIPTDNYIIPTPQPAPQPYRARVAVATAVETSSRPY